MTIDTNKFHPRIHAAQNPDALAFKMCTTGETVNFGQLETRANQGAHLLREAGIQIGDHIAILMENRREFLEICFAADRAGVYYTTISTHLTSDEIAYVLKDCGARLLIGSPRYLPMIAKFEETLNADCQVLIVGGDKTQFASWDTAISEQPETPISDEMQGLDMLYSSGTTGRPKGIKWQLTGEKPGCKTMLIELLTSLFGYSDQTRYLCPAPLYHAAPLRHSMVTIKMGGAVFVMDRFDALRTLMLIEIEKITHSQWVPTMFVRLLKLPEQERQKFDLSSMQMAVHAAAPCPVDVKRQIIDWWGEIVHEYYAGTENNGFTAITSKEWLKYPGSVGQAKLGVLHVCDEAGHELPIGDEGEVYFESGHQFSYHNDEEKTASSRNDKGWTTLGDIGRLNAEDYLFLTDRKSFLIISGGVNIYPQETEDVLLAHAAVMDAAVIGVPNEEFGEEVKAIIEPMPHVTHTPELERELIEYCQKHLSKLKCPKSIEFRAELPRSATGKLYKRKLKEEFWRKRL